MVRHHFIRGLALAVTISGAGAALAFGAGGQHAMPLDFGAADTDGDGMLTQGEIESWRMARAKEADTDKDGFVTLEEMKAAIIGRMEQRAQEMAQHRLEVQDTDGDGRLSLAEMEPGPRAGRMFDRIDTNGDGNLSKDEVDAAQADMMQHHRP